MGSGGGGAGEGVWRGDILTVPALSTPIPSDPTMHTSCSSAHQTAKAKHIMATKRTESSVNICHARSHRYLQECRKNLLYFH